MSSHPATTPPLPGGAAIATPSQDPLVAFLSGKRDSDRHPCHVPAVLKGACGPAAATVLDLSESGALVQIDEPAFVEAEVHSGMHAYLELVQVHASGDLKLSFPGCGLDLPAAIVRWTAGSAGTEPSRVGLRFTRTLASDELAALRSGSALPAHPPAGLTPTPSAPTHVPRRGERLAALVFHALKPELGPLAAGAIVALGPDVALLRLEGEADAARLGKRLASGALFLVILRHGLTCWEGTVRPGPVRPTPDGSALDVTLLGHALVPPALLGHLRRA